MKYTLPALLTCWLTAGLLFSGCDTRMDFVSGNAVDLRFSTDTITFDTVFTDVGSATQIMKIYNDAADPITIDRILVEGRTGVEYNFNVDGFSGPEARDVPIFGGDSIFLFVEVKVDPTAPEEISPFIAEDRLIFETGDAREDVVLMAFGQNAFYINGFNRGQFGGLTPSTIGCEAGTVVFPVDLPTVIYGSLIIDSCIVQALPGTRIFFHGGVQKNEEAFGNLGFFNDGFIFTLPDGSLQLMGTQEDPVVLRTDRLEDRFQTDPAKYRGLIFGAGSRNNIVRHTELYNSVVGVTADSAAEVTIENSIIAYTGGPAVSGRLSDLTVRNTLLHSNFGNSLQVILGGNLTMDHVTIANYGVDALAAVITNVETDDDDNTFVAPLRMRINNSIISGSGSSELVLFDGTLGDEPGFFDVAINNSIVKTDDQFLEDFPTFYESVCQNCINTVFADTLFRNLSEDDYRLDSLSIARNLGVFDGDLPTDIRGVMRSPDSTDIGAFEFSPGEL